MTVCYWCGAKDTLADVGKELDDGKYKFVKHYLTDNDDADGERIGGVGSTTK